MVGVSGLALLGEVTIGLNEETTFSNGAGQPTEAVMTVMMRMMIMMMVVVGTYLNAVLEAVKLRENKLASQRFIDHVPCRIL